ncbi:hypothetical protein V9K67_26745 [Paraflavisolibacter sp. H34]|uniref:hypothetical protein n=1 Tax=Huijunlia imazamoxiresistens TaxID=3127457 RepID=UPI00301A7327
MMIKEINGYSVQISSMPVDSRTLFVTLIDESVKSHSFSLAKIDGDWCIRNPLTIPAFIVEMEHELNKVLGGVTSLEPMNL